ncbi:TIGR03086 family metal-binding protein [Crossiella sp. CA-258035]|uniref:TIGR03086 family metal-binding protein n=1 Tax=Crossiella sp. CA-258035 TaxID=2981138 RepID=UPI0024BD2919|nr:TIGR03086 family metal-binding protein [Crossiella sp. CA-258035]WHT18410.1 TIGR03086 family metal-binding protein [Crossiella sp. CA-258035]
MLTNELLVLHRRAVLDSVAAVDQVEVADLIRPTPCADWTLAELLAHMTVQHHGFAAAAEGNGADPEVWRVRPLGPDPVREYRAAADRVLAAFAAEGVPAREFALAEFGASFPAARAIGFHLIDYVVHGWDVARALGNPYRLAPELVEVSSRIAFAVPDDGDRRRSGAPFRPALAAEGGANGADLVVAGAIAALAGLTTRRTRSRGWDVFPGCGGSARCGRWGGRRAGRGNRGG